MALHTNPQIKKKAPTRTFTISNDTKKKPKPVKGKNPFYKNQDKLKGGGW